MTPREIYDALVIVGLGCGALLAMIAATGIVDAISQGRLGRFLGLDVRDGDQ